jgi:alpha-galactosidase
MTAGEDRAHFSLWAMLAAPLIAGNDLRLMSEETRAILTNAAVIAVDQDPLGIQGFKYRDDGERQTWARPLAGGAWALAFLNRGEPAWSVDVDWSREHLEDTLSDRRARFGEVEYRIRDLWAGAELGTTATPLAGEVPGHDVWMLRLEPVDGGES